MQTLMAFNIIIIFFAGLVATNVRIYPKNYWIGHLDASFLDFTLTKEILTLHPVSKLLLMFLTQTSPF